jgi:benzoyl-CoA reductase subunit B
MTEQAGSIVGRGMSEGARLFREWFSELTTAPERGERAAYVFVMGSLAELLRTFGLHTVFPEINSLQTAVRRVAHEFLDQAEDYGYSPDICGYVKADVAVQLRGGQHPMGRIPPPSIVVLTTACNTYIKWAEIWERLHGVPVVTIDVPGTRAAGGAAWPSEDDYRADLAYVTAQLRELVAECERVTGVGFDIDRLRETLALANRVHESYGRLLDLNTKRPAPFNAVTDGTVFMGVANGLRGTPAGARYFEELVEEMTFKARAGLGPLDEERYRLTFLGVPCYPIFRRFNDMFAEWGGAFVTSSYLWFASGGADLGWQYDLRRPIESLAEGLLASVRHATDCMLFPDRALASAIERFRLDGVVFHSVKSCRTVSTGLADTRRAVSERHGIPSLLLEADMMDRRVVSEAQLKNRIDAFFEGLAMRAAPGGART